MKKLLRFDFLIFLMVVSLPFIAWGLSAPILPLYLDSIGISPSILGMMIGVQMGALALGEGILGFVSDKLGHKTVMYAAPFLCIGSFLLLIVSDDLPMLFLSFILSGLAIACGGIAGRVFGATYGSSEEKPFYMALIQTDFRVSQAAGSLASGYIASASGYIRVFQTGLVLSFFPLMTLFTNQRNRDKAVKMVRPADATLTKAKTMSVGENWRLLSAFIQGLAAVMIFIGHGVCIAFLPLLAWDVAGVGDKQVGLLFATMNILGAILTFPAASATRRIGKELALIFGLLLAGISLAGMALLPSFGWIMFFVVINSFARPLFTVPGLALISDTLTASRQGAGMGLYGLSEDVGLMIGSALGGFLWTGFGYRTTFFMGSIAAAVGILVCIWLVRVMRRHKQVVEMQKGGYEAY